MKVYRKKGKNIIRAGTMEVITPRSGISCWRGAKHRVVSVGEILREIRGHHEKINQNRRKNLSRKKK
jgi:hypothetical protein